MNFTKLLQLTAFQTLGTDKPIPLVGVYDATQFGSKERIGTNYLVRSGYGDIIRIRVYEDEQAITKVILDDYKWSEITPYAAFQGLSGRISTNKKGEPIICGMAEKVALVSPLPPSRVETISKFFEDPLGEEL